MDWQTLEALIANNRNSDDYFRQLGFPRGRQDAMDYLGQLKQSDPAYQTQQLIQTTVDQYNKRLEDYNKKYKEFDEKNPFEFDKVLEEEKTKVKQRLDPYYEQTLSDFLRGVNIQRTRSLEDERTLLTELNQDTEKYQGQEKQNLMDAIERSREGYADAGLYGSGQQLREEGRIKTESNKNLSDTLTQQNRTRNQIQTSTKRLGEDLTLNESLKQRELEQDKTYQTESQALNQIQQRERQREFERGQYTGNAPGVDPLQYQNSLYNLLG